MVERIMVRVAAKRRLADDIHGFDLVRADGGDLPPFAAGAHIDVEVEPGLVRQYSLCAPAHERGYAIAVQREATSRGGSAAMVERMSEGDLLAISGPRNHFPLAAGAERSILVAGGIGITPILCMAERLANVGAAFELHYGARTRSRMAFRDRILAAAFAGDVHLYIDDEVGGPRLDPALLLRSPQPGVHLYVCGPAPMIEAVLAAARSLGWNDANVHREFFAPAATSADVHGDFAFDVRIASTGKIVRVPADRSITAALEEQGIAIPVSCERGVCGTCLTRVIEGRPDHRDSYLTPEERSANDQLLPCRSRSHSPMLVIDL